MHLTTTSCKPSRGRSEAMAHQYGTCKRPCQLCAGTAAHAAQRGTVRLLGGDQVTPPSQTLVRRLGSTGTVQPNHLLRHICREIHYRWIFRQNTVHLCTPRLLAEAMERTQQSQGAPYGACQCPCQMRVWTAAQGGQHTPYLEKPNIY